MREPTEPIFSSPEQVWKNFMSGSLHPRCFLSFDYLQITRNWQQDINNRGFTKAAGGSRVDLQKTKSCFHVQTGLTWHVVLNVRVCVCE